MGELNSKNRKWEAGRGRLVCAQSAQAKTVLARCAQVQSPTPRLPGVKSKFNSREKERRKLQGTSKLSCARALRQSVY